MSDPGAVFPLPGGAPIPRAVARRALEWLIALQAEQVPPATRAAWLAWRAADPDHERAWQRIETMNGTLRGMSSPVKAALAHATLAPPASAKRRQAIKTLTLLIFAGGAAWMAEEKTPWRQWVADQRTGVGERRDITLGDGTQLVLNTDTAVNIRFSAAERRVRLIAGEILVDTAADAGPAPRPFLVETAQGEAWALGTRYAVRQRDGASEVSVFKGAVEIRPDSATAPALVLQAGQRASFTAAAAGAPSPADESSTAWVDGFLIARGMRLADFIAELGRYSRHPLACDAAVSGLRVSGSYPLGDVGKVLDTVGAALGLRIETVTRFWGRQVVRISVVPRGRAG